MDLREFYKDYYDKTLERKNEINNSLSVLVGIITALIAALFYALTTFDLEFNRFLSIVFALLSLMVVFLLTRSVYYLIRALSDSHDGYDYAYLDSANILSKYYESLIEYYMSLPENTLVSSNALAKTEFSDHITQMLIGCIIINHSNNNSKNLNRYKCHEFIIYSIVTVSLLFIVFYINFVFN